MKLLYLFINFCKIGIFAVGGGYAVVPFVFEMADNSNGINASGWLTREFTGNMLAVAQSLPGPIGGNLAAYTGFHYAGILGGLIAALALITPSLIILILVARTLETYRKNRYVISLFSGLRPAAAGLLSAAAFGAIALSIRNTAAPVWYEYLRWKESLIFLLLFFLIYKFKKHPIIYIAAAGAAGVFLKL